MSVDVRSPDRYRLARPLLRWGGWFLFFAFTVALRLPGLSKSIWLDEAFTLAEVHAPSLYQAIRSSDHPPLYLMILRVWSGAGGGEAFFRLPSVLFGALTVLILVLMLLRENRRAAFLVGVMAALSPAMLRFSQEIRDYALLLFFTALSYYFANRLLKSSGRGPSWLGMAASLSGAVLTHLVGIFLIPALAGYLACSTRLDRWRELPRLSTAFLPPVLIFGLYYFLVLSPEVRGRSGAEWGEGALSAGLLVFAFLYLTGFFTWSDPLPALSPSSGLIPANPLSVLVLLMLSALITSIILGSWRKSWPYLASALLYWGGLYVYSSLSVVIISERTMVPGLVPLLCFAAVSLGESTRPAFVSRAAFLAVGVLGLATAINWMTYGAYAPLEDWRSLCAQLSASYRPGDRLVLVPGYTAPAMAYYAPHIPLDAGLMPGANQPAGLLPSIIQRAERENKSVFVVFRADARTQAGPERYPALQAALNRRFEQVQAWQWGRLMLFQYGRAR